VSDKKSDLHDSETQKLFDEALKLVEEREKKSQGLDAAEVQSEEADVKAPAKSSHKGNVVDREVYLKLAADYQNFKKRALKEHEDAKRAGKDHILKGVLDILDNIERGLEHAESDADNVVNGMRMVLSQADNWLKAEGLERVGTVGNMFDPAVHEAVAQKPAEGKKNGMILEEVKCGYRWFDRLLRPASVVVCKNDDSDQGEES